MKKINRYFKDIDIEVIVKNFLLKKKKAINFFVLKHFKNSLLIIAFKDTHPRQGKDWIQVSYYAKRY